MDLTGIEGLMTLGLRLDFRFLLNEFINLIIEYFN